MSGSRAGAAFRICEATQRDAGTGIIRLTPADMATLDLSDGDIVSIVGGRRTVARLATAEAGSCERGSIQTDGIIRQNLRSGLNETLYLSRIEPKPARTVVLIPADETATFFQSGKRSIASRLASLFGPSESATAVQRRTDLLRALEQRAFEIGDRIRVHVFGRYLYFTVGGTTPDGPVLCGEDSVIRVDMRSAARMSPAISYEDIGGLSKEIARVREMIEIPLRYPEVFGRLGVEAPKGILLYGPPGCGKTMIARAVAHEAGVRFVNINGPEVMQQGYGESEALLRKIFREAQESTATIIFFDEIDALAPNRDTVLGDVEKRVVAQLLALLDGVHSRGKVIIIAATNLPNNIDPALRRPGRLDREIGLTHPDRKGRLEILEVHSRSMPLAPDVDLDYISSVTHGFLGADLAALCREAAMLCVRDLLPEMDYDHASVPEELLASLQVGMNHFEQAMSEIEISTTREVSTEIPNVNWHDIGGLDEIKQQLREAVEWPLRYAERFKHIDADPPRGILLSGRPGTGKSLLAKALATESGVNFITVKGPELLSKWVGESERGIREIFKKARQASPAIIFFDEIDAIVPRRNGDSGGGHISERMVGQFLLDLDIVHELKGVMVLGATNRLDLIDPALLRPGRFDLVLDLPDPDLATRRAILAIHCRGSRLGGEVDLESLARDTQGLTGAELESICRRAAMYALRDSISTYPEEQFEAFDVQPWHFAAAVRMIREMKGEGSGIPPFLR